MDPDLKASRITMGLHAVLGIIMGWLSPLVAVQFSTNWVPGILGIALLIAVGFITEKLVAKKDVKFWLGNGVVIYLLVWLVSWTYFLNLV